MGSERMKALLEFQEAQRRASKRRMIMVLAIVWLVFHVFVTVVAVVFEDGNALAAAAFWDVIGLIVFGSYKLSKKFYPDPTPLDDE